VSSYFLSWLSGLSIQYISRHFTYGYVDGSIVGMRIRDVNFVWGIQLIFRDPSGC
jgi:hypothetical protein